MIDKPILLMFAGDMKIDNKKYKEYFKVKAKMLSPEDTERFTSHPIGGVCPFGLPLKFSVYKVLINMVSAVQVDVTVAK